mgnify:CR=1 FL=1
MKKRNLFKMLAVACVVGITLIGCGNSKNTEDTSKKSTVTVTDIKGEVEIPKEPERIVDLSGNSDILSILGYKVIGTANSDAYDYTKFPKYLEDTLKGAEILGYSMQDTMDIEQVMNLNPDLIIAILIIVNNKSIIKLKVMFQIMIDREYINLLFCKKA